jgi:hypothetical protein
LVAIALLAIDYLPERHHAWELDPLVNATDEATCLREFADIPAKYCRVSANYDTIARELGCLRDLIENTWNCPDEVRRAALAELSRRGR